MTTIQVLSPGWHVGDGEPEVRVGGVWPARIEVQPSRPHSKDDWRPDVEDCPGSPESSLSQIDAIAGGFAFTATAVVTGQRWTVPGLNGLRIAVPSVHRGAVAGRGVFVHDTHFIDEPEVIAALGTPLRVRRIQWAAPRTALLALDESVERAEVHPTHDQVVQSRSADGTFIIMGDVEE